MSQASKQYLFVAHRDVTVTSLKGYSFNFVKGVPQHVPKACHSEVIEKGILPFEDGEVSVAKIDEIAKENDPKQHLVLAPETQEERDSAIRSACEALMERNRSEDFTAGGVPSAPAVSAALGWKVDLREIRPIWNELKQERNKG